MNEKFDQVNCKHCIGCLLDKEEHWVERLAAAESLAHCSGHSVERALFQVLLDETEPDYLREEAATSLGSIWIESGIDYEMLVQIPQPLLDEIFFEFDTANIVLEKEKLGTKLSFFLEHFGNRKFLA